MRHRIERIVQRMRGKSFDTRSIRRAARQNWSEQADPAERMVEGGQRVIRERREGYGK